MDEKLIERKLREAVKHSGGLALKFVSPGFDGMPDRLLLFQDGKAAFAEIKSTGKKPRPLQMSRKKKLESFGFKVFVIDKPEQIGEVINEIHTS